KHTFCPPKFFCHNIMPPLPGWCIFVHLCYSHVIPSEFSAGCDPEDTNPSQSTFSFPLKTNFSLLFRLYRAATAYGFFLQICRPYGASRSTQCYGIAPEISLRHCKILLLANLAVISYVQTFE